MDVGLGFRLVVNVGWPSSSRRPPAPLRATQQWRPCGVRPSPAPPPVEPAQPTSRAVAQSTCMSRGGVGGAGTLAPSCRLSLDHTRPPRQPAAPQPPHLAGQSARRLGGRRTRCPGPARQRHASQTPRSCMQKRGVPGVVCWRQATSTFCHSRARPREAGHTLTRARAPPCRSGSGRPADAAGMRGRRRQQQRRARGLCTRASEPGGP